MARTRRPGRPSRKRSAKSKTPRKAPRRSSKKRPSAKALEVLKERKRRKTVKKFHDFGYALAHWNEEPHVIESKPPIPLVDLSQVEVYRAAPLGIYQTREEAGAALAGIQQSQLRGNFNSGLAVGLAAVAVIGLGIVLCYVLFRRKSDEDRLSSATPNIVINNSPEARGLTEKIIDVKTDDEENAIDLPGKSPIENVASAIVEALRKEQQAGRPMRTFMQSYTLPFIGDPRSEAIRVATAGTAPFEVIVRCVEPPGSHAILAFDPVELNVRDVPVVQTIGTAYSGFPVGNVLPVPAGQFQLIKLRPRQVLYAKGTVAPGGANQSTATAGVILAVTAADFVSGIRF